MNKASVEQLQESLSALVDGEATELELRRLLKANDEDYAQMRKQWLNYQTASSALKQEVPAVNYADLSSSIMAAIDEEPEIQTSEPKNTVSKVSNLWSGVGRFAVAASFAGAVVLGVQLLPGEQNNQIVDSVPAPTASTPSFVQGASNETRVSTVSNENGIGKATEDKPAIVITDSTKQQLKEAGEQVERLMIEHAQNSAQNTQQGVLSHSRIPESE